MLAKKPDEIARHNPDSQHLAAGKGVRFQMVINKHSPAAEEFRALFDPIEGAEVIEASDNAISMQGFSDREGVIAFPCVESYTAVLVQESHFSDTLNSRFESRVAHEGYLRFH